MGWMDLIDNTLEKVFNAKPDDGVKRTERRREGCLAGIDSALKSLENKETKGPRGWYTSKGDVTRCTLRTGSKQVPLGGKDAVYVPSERAADFYKALREDVAAGKLDSDINAAWASDGAGPAKKTSTGKTRELKPEHKEAIRQATIKRHAERKAAKAAQQGA